MPGLNSASGECPPRRVMRAVCRVTEEGEELYELREGEGFFEVFVCARPGTSPLVPPQAPSPFGLQLVASLRGPLWLIVLATSSIKSNDPKLPAPSLLSGGLKIARSLVCGHSVQEIVDSRAPQGVEALKAFWDLPESVSFT